MEIGEFSDDFFEDSEVKTPQRQQKYKAKILLPLWYMDPQLTSPDGDGLNTVKHQADYFYFTKDFAKSAELYEQCLDLVPASNISLRREIMENISHSLLHVGSAEKALAWSLKLYASSCNNDQKVVSMNLLATVCHVLGKYKEELEALHCCINAHKCCPDFWMRLGLCYAGLFRINLPGYSINKTTEQEYCCAFSSKMPSARNSPLEEKQVPKNPSVNSTPQCDEASTSTSNHQSYELSVNSKTSCETSTETSKCEICTLGIQIVSTCLIQTSMLMKNGGQNLLASERDTKVDEEISASLRHMEVHQSFIDEASKMLGSEFLMGIQDTTENVLLNQLCSNNKNDADDTQSEIVQ